MNGFQLINNALNKKKNGKQKLIKKQAGSVQ